MERGEERFGVEKNGHAKDEHWPLWRVEPAKVPYAMEEPPHGAEEKDGDERAEARDDAARRRRRRRRAALRRRCIEAGIIGKCIELPRAARWLHGSAAAAVAAAQQRRVEIPRGAPLLRIRLVDDEAAGAAAAEVARDRDVDSNVKGEDNGARHIEEQKLLHHPARSEAARARPVIDSDPAPRSIRRPHLVVALEPADVDAYAGEQGQTPRERVVQRLQALGARRPNVAVHDDAVEVEREAAGPNVRREVRELNDVGLDHAPCSVGLQLQQRR